MLYLSLMPTIAKFTFCKLETRYRDNAPPHVHVLMADRSEALIEIKNLAVTGNISAHKLTEVLSWMRTRRETLLEEWVRLQQ